MQTHAEPSDHKPDDPAAVLFLLCASQTGAVCCGHNEGFELPIVLVRVDHHEEPGRGRHGQPVGEMQLGLVLAVVMRCVAGCLRLARSRVTARMFVR